MIMKMLELFRDILFSNQNSGVSDVFRDLGPLVLFFALSSRFLNFKWWKKFLKSYGSPGSFSEASALSSYKQVAYIKKTVTGR